MDAVLALLGPGGAVALLLVLGAAVKWLDSRRVEREKQIEARAAQLDAERESEVAELRAENKRLLSVAYRYFRQLIKAGITPDPPNPGGDDE